MKRIIVAVFFLKSLCSIASAQEDLRVNSGPNAGYKNAIGIRLGPSVPAVKSGISYKRIMGTKALEGILSFGDGISFCGLYEIYKPIPVENLQWFYGFGGYAGFSNSVTNIGLAGVGGLDY